MSESHQKGPEQVKPAENYWTIDNTKPVKLRMRKDGIAAADPVSIPGFLNRAAEKFPDHAALVFKNSNKVSQTITYSEYREKVHKMAKVFIKLGLEERHSVSVLAFNSPEWFISELAAIHAGGIIAGVYTTNSADSVAHILETSKSNIVIVDDAKQMEKIHAIKHKLPHLKAVIQTVPPYAPYVKRADGYYRWSEVEEMNVDDVAEEFNNRLANIAVNECCCLIYTSGTVGTPKGVMLSHDNITWDSYTIGKRLKNVEYGKEVLVSYLPLSHVAAQMVDMFLGLQFAGTVHFADKDALKGTLVNTLLEAKPTRLLGVPRVYEKIQEKMTSAGARSGAARQMIASWAKSVTLQHHIDAMEGKATNSWQYRLVKNLIMSKVKDALGLGRCLTLVTGAAPMSSETKRYFMSLDMPIIEAFGMSETTGAHVVTDKDCYDFDTAGMTLEGAETMIYKPDVNGHGEICMRGRNIMMGYIGEEAKTAEGFDEDGWLHSGDIGYVDEKGNLYVTGRIKELLITAGGENIPPILIENAVKKEIPALSNAFLVGDRRKYLTMLVSLKTLVDTTTGVPKDELQHETIKWLKNVVGVEYAKLSEVIEAGPDPKVLKAIEEGIIRANKHAISNAQKVQKFAMLPQDFSIATGELGPTLKVKRNFVADKYKEIIEKLY